AARRARDRYPLAGVDLQMDARQRVRFHLVGQELLGNSFQPDQRSLHGEKYEPNPFWFRNISSQRPRCYVIPNLCIPSAGLSLRHAIGMSAGTNDGSRLPLPLAIGAAVIAILTPWALARRMRTFLFRFPEVLHVSLPTESLAISSPCQSPSFDRTEPF